MASKFFERRAIRNQLKTYLESKGWIDLNWAEGFASLTLETIVPPYVTVNLDDLGTEDLEMGRDPIINKTFTRRTQVDVIMEDEDRVSAITDDIADFIDLESIIIMDSTNNVIGSMISDTQTILVDINVPTFDDPELLRWSGTVVVSYAVHYPNG